MFTNLPSNLKAIAALETAKRLSLRLKTQTMAVLRLLMSLLLVGTQFRASDPVVDTEVAVEVVIVAGSRGIWPGTVHKVAVAVEVVEGMVVEAAVEEVEEGVTTVAVLAILPGSVLIVDVDFRVWSGNSKKET